MFSFTVDPDDGERYEVTADSRDVLMWERQKSGRSIAKLLAETHIVDAYALAYIASKRQGLIDCPPREFEENYRLILGQEPEPDPTKPGR